MTDEPVERGGFPQMRTWQEPTVRSPGGGPEYGDMILALRDFLDDVAAAAPDTATTVALAHDLRDWSDRLAPAAVPERKRIFARRLDLPGHEIAKLEMLDDGWKLSGTAMFAFRQAPSSWTTS